MSRVNPYDAYDEIDPYDDADDFDLDDSGAFDFVEDEYDSMGYEDDGLGYEDDMPQEPIGRGSTAEFPRTEVRQRFGSPVPGTDGRPAQGPVLRRKNGRNRRRAEEPAFNQGPAQQPVAQRPAPARERRRGRKHHGCLVSLLVIVALVVGVYWVLARPVDESLAFGAAEQETVNGTLSWSVPGMPYYVLALGSDAREGDTASRTDTMVLMRVDLLGGKLTMVSIPRDTMVQIEGYGTQKINAAYAYGSAGGAVRAVSNLLDVPINHVAVIHFEELAGLIDYLGGVTVNVPVDVYDPDYTGLSLSAGMHTLDGQTALLWARSRHGFDDGDYQRQEDQRILITAIMNRMLSLSPSEIPSALRQVGDLVGTDMRCYNLIPLFLRFKLAGPTVYSCAVPTTSEYVDNLWYEIVDEEATSELMQVVKAGGDPSTLAY